MLLKFQTAISIEAFFWYIFKFNSSFPIFVTIMTWSLAEWVRVLEHVFKLYFSIIISNPEKFLTEYTLTPA